MSLHSVSLLGQRVMVEFARKIERDGERVGDVT